MKTNIRRGVAVAATVAAMAGASFGMAGTASATVGDNLNIPGTSTNTSRVAGVDRIDTALKAANVLLADPSVQAEVVITRDDDYADALSAGPLAASLKGAILVTPSAKLDARVQAKLVALAATAGKVHVTIVGGTSAISDATVTAISNAVGADPVTGKAGTVQVVDRIKGSDRYTTSLSVAQTITHATVDANGKYTAIDGGDVFLATGRNFADAMTAGAAAAQDGTAGMSSPVILTDDSTLSATAQAFVAARTAVTGNLSGTSKVYAVGAAATAAAPSGAVALNGSDRYETSALVAKQFFDGKAGVNAGIASGATFADAVIGANFMAQKTGPLLLTDPANLSDATSKYLNSNRGNITEAFIFGGTGTISFDVTVQAAKALFI